MLSNIFNKLSRSSFTYCGGVISLLFGLSGCQQVSGERLLQANNEAAQTELASKQAVEVPFKVVNQHILVPISINGSKPLDFVLDTGAPITAVVETANTKDISLSFGQEVNVGGAGQGKSVTAKLVPESNVYIGGVGIDGLTALWLPMGAVPYFEDEKDAYFDGIIGHDLLNRYSVLIDQDRQMLTLYSNEDMPELTSPWQKLDLIFENQHPYVNAALDGQTEVKLLLDTGSTAALSLTPSSHEKIDWPTEYYVSESQGLSGVEEERNALRSSLSLASHSVKNFITSYSDGWNEANSQGILGNTVLNQFNVWFDYANSQIWLKPRNNDKPSLLADRSGIKLLPMADKGAKLIKIYPDSNANKIGLKEGDVIVKVNNQPIDRNNFDALNDLLKSKSAQLHLCWLKESASTNANICENLELLDR